VFLGHRGFTLGEVLASLIALGIIVLTVQSLMLVANNFLSQQRSSMSSMEEQAFFSKLICHKFQRPVFVAQDPSRSFKYDPDVQSYAKKATDRPDPEQNPATLSVPLLAHSQNLSGLSVSAHSAVQTFLSTVLAVPVNEDDHDKVLRVHINDKAASFGSIENSGGGSHNNYSLFYDIYADDHTLPTFMVKQGEEDDIELGKVSEGFIYASRCIKNEVDASHSGSFIAIGGDSPKYSIIDRMDNSDMTDDEVLATALYVLEQRWRPFYFPDQDRTKNQVVCCDTSRFGNTNTFQITVNTSAPYDVTSPSNCANLEKYTPIIYVIKISSDGADLENKIASGDGTGDMSNPPSMLGYLENSASAFSGSCESTTHDVKWSHVPNSSTGISCFDVVKEHYFRQLGARFVHPVKFENVEELPLVKRDRRNAWAYGFIAPSFGSQGMHKEFKILSVENKCHTSLPVGLCGKAVPGLDLSLSANKIEGKSVAEYFIARVSHCPFHYVTMDNSAGTLPLGLDRVE